MASFHAGQRLPASHLNALTAISVDLSGGPTSGDTELLLTGTLTIPAAPIDRLVVPTMMLRLNATTSGGWNINIRDSNISGTNRGTTRVLFAESGLQGAVALGRPFVLAAGATHTLVATIARFAGSGTATLSGSGLFNQMTADLKPAP